MQIIQTMMETNNVIIIKKKFKAQSWSKYSIALGIHFCLHFAFRWRGEREREKNNKFS